MSNAFDIIARVLGRKSMAAAVAPMEDKPPIVQKVLLMNELKEEREREMGKVAKPSRGSFPLHYTTRYRGDLVIDVENRKGSFRRGKDTDGKPWSTKMEVPYGEIRDSVGVDGDPVDCFIGPEKQSDFVLVVHTKVLGSDNKYDEDKVILGTKNREEAMKIFRKHYHNWRDHYLASTPMTLYELKAKLERTKKKPRMLDKEAMSKEASLDALSALLHVAEDARGQPLNMRAASILGAGSVLKNAVTGQDVAPELGGVIGAAVGNTLGKRIPGNHNLLVRSVAPTVAGLMAGRMAGNIVSNMAADIGKPKQRDGLNIERALVRMHARRGEVPSTDITDAAIRQYHPEGSDAAEEMIAARNAGKAFVGTELAEKTASVTTEDLRGLAYTKGWDWDNDPRFLDLVKEVSGQQYLELLDEAQRGEMYEKMASPDDCFDW